jgi:NADH dehydrogenase/NADH:ubiquinone oxidoreductase subunit G
MIRLIIDGRVVEAKEGSTVLEAANQAKIRIPTICYHESLSSNGSCRVCTVEIMINGKSSLTTACTCPVESGMRINTDSAAAVNARTLAIELLLAQQPHSAEITEIARKLGIEKPSFKLKQEECILCQLCVRTCHEIVCADAITFQAKGKDRDIEEASVVHSREKCIGCGSCAFVCPTAAITMDDTGNTRVIKTPSGNLNFKLKKCKICGMYWAPEKQIEYIAKISGMSILEYDGCFDCRI